MRVNSLNMSPCLREPSISLSTENPAARYIAIYAIIMRVESIFLRYVPLPGLRRRPFPRRQGKLFLLKVSGSSQFSLNGLLCSLHEQPCSGCPSSSLSPVSSSVVHAHFSAQHEVGLVGASLPHEEQQVLPAVITWLWLWLCLCSLPQHPCPSPWLCSCVCPFK